MAMLGCDLSHWNVIKNYNELSDIFNFAMIKFGGEESEAGKLTRDNMFKMHYDECVKRGMHVGCYFFISNKSEALLNSPIEICEQFADALAPYRFDMPIALDVEGDIKVTQSQLTDYVIKWCDCMEMYGYYVTIYGSDISTFKEKLDLTRISSYDKWVARYNAKPQYVKNYGMWQSSSQANILGFEWGLDIDLAYKNYPSIIQSKQLNNII